MTEHDTIAVVDNGGQFAHLIAAKVRDEVHVKTIIIDPSTDANEVLDVKGLILSGGPDSIHEEGSVQINPDLLDLDVPILGLCYGLHQMAVHYGGKVHRSERREYGFAKVRLRHHDPIFVDVPQDDRVWMSHGDKVTEMPKGFNVIGSTENCPIAAISDRHRRRWAFQFHPEVEDTLHGTEMLANFVIDICHAQPDWMAGDIVEEIVSDIKDTVGDKKVLTLVSGGVDSTVVATLVARALPPEQTFYIHVDTGLMRKDESSLVLDALKQQGLENLKIVHAQEMYMDALEGIVDPEEKRKIIGKLFIDIVDREAKDAWGGEWILAQGTLYPDTIESGGTKHADVIKTHHNRVDVIMDMIREGRVVEPLKELYKAEVRQIGELLGLPKDLVQRHPFPGPGLGIRALCQNEDVIGSVLPDLDTIQKAVERYVANDRFATGKLTPLVLPVRSVGVKGDSRSYEHPVALWCDEKVEWSDLKLFATRLVNATRGINRCIVMMSPESFKNPVPVPRTITKKRIEILREADHIVMEALRKFDLYDTVWQCPTVLVPVSFGRGEMVVIRPVWSNRAMTAEVSELPDEFFLEVVTPLVNLQGIESVAVDVTSKPPGTIEWE